MKLLAKILITAGALLLIAQFVPGVSVDSFYHAVIAALVLALLNIFVRPILFFLTLPVTLLTLGLFIFIINAGLFMFAASFLEGFAVDSFLSALFGSLLITIVSTLSNKFLS